MESEEKKVLILDEDMAARQRLGLRLGSLKLKALEASTLDSAREMILKNRPDLVITEWKFGGVEGEELVRQLKFPVHRICVFTAIPLERMEVTARRVGVEQVFHKNDRYKLLEYLEQAFEEGAGVVPSNQEKHEGKHILLIDDSATVRLTLRKALEVEFKDCVIREADDGRTALSEMTHKRVHLIVTDLEMPGMDGNEFLERMRSNPLLRKKPIIVFSGNITPELRQTYDQEKNIKFLVKPCDPFLLVEAAREMLVKLPGAST